MGSHGGAIQVYGPSRMRWSAPLLAPPASSYMSWAIVLVAGTGAALQTTHLWLPGLALIGLAALMTVLLVATALIRPRVVLAGREHLKTWQGVETACVVVQRAWPAVRSMTGVKNVRPVIEDARWDLACLIASRGRLSGACNEAKWAGYGLDDDDPLRGELATRRDQLAGHLSSMDAEIAARADRLRSLADRCARFASHQGALRWAPKVARRARRAVQAADSAMMDEAAWRVRPDPATDVSERTEAVLAAYRELTAIPGYRR
ncbi:hypothetical protein GCM10023322_07270 [Rugosimonospora acidiphila]|uniref:Integral membrane protein n=1 Tax=Rugosimonospora acidiphila TaxID=556531 RepID=A0ABP9RKP6_9ACTN